MSHASDSLSPPPSPGPEPPYTALLDKVRDPQPTDWEHAWVGLAPTFSSRELLKRWKAATKKGSRQADFFHHPEVRKLQRAVARAVARTYQRAQRRGESYCLFDRVERDESIDPHGQPRQHLHFFCRGGGPAFTVRLGPSPEVLEYSLQPVPLTWLYDPRFVELLQALVWDVPASFGLFPSQAHGGSPFSISAKSFLTGSLLCDGIADRLNHPELACFTMDHPRSEARSFRATKARRTAFLRIIEQYWEGAFHPRAIGTPTVEQAFFQRGFGPAAAPPPGLLSREHHLAGPIGTLHEVFQTNFVFARAVRQLAQRIHPGHWQRPQPDSDHDPLGHVLRHSEGNLHHLHIIGERVLPSDPALDPNTIPELDAPLAPEHLDREASWESRAQSNCTSARDFAEALLLEVHRAQYLQLHPVVRPRQTLLQDRLLGDAEETLLALGGGERLSTLRQQARAHNIQASGGRIRSDFIEPEVLFWEVFHRLPAGERAAIAREAIWGFVSRVTESASCDPRRQDQSHAPTDPLEWHRHRIHPLLFDALATEKPSSTDRDLPQREYRRFLVDKVELLSRRPPWSVGKQAAPWESPHH